MQDIEVPTVIIGSNMPPELAAEVSSALQELGVAVKANGVRPVLRVVLKNGNSVISSDVNIALLVDAGRAAPDIAADRAPNMFLARLEARGDRLLAVQDDDNGRHWVRSGRCGERNCWQLAEPLAYFIPEHAIDPSRPRDGATLWAEVTLPLTGAPRPIRLEVRK